jgi:DNA-binding NarL/FixJ family response regulator
MPEVVLLDIAMPGKDGISAASIISLACPSTKIVMLTVSEHEDDLVSAFKAGAKGYVLKGVSGRELAKVILQLVAEGLSNREIGEKLHLAEKTIKHYMTNILAKLEVGSRVQVALMAQKRRLEQEADK